jgi:hypothetical protein
MRGNAGGKKAELQLTSPFFKHGGCAGEDFDAFFNKRGNGISFSLLFTGKDGDASKTYSSFGLVFPDPPQVCLGISREAN